MYRILGADGKEYGPVSADVLRQWIAQGRANALTRVLPEGSTEWKPLSDLPEFAADLAAKATASGPSPTPPSLGALPGTAASSAQVDVLTKDYQLEIGRCFSRGWELVKNHFWLTVGTAFLIHLIAGAVGSIPLLGLALNAVFIGGLDWMFLKLVRGQKAEVGDAFAGFNIAFGALALFGLVAMLLVAIGFLLCFLPGVYLAVAWLFFTPLIIMDKGLEFWDAMEMSRKVVTRHWWKLFGFSLVCGLVLIAGAILCGVGILIALPLVRAAIVYAYEDIFGTRAASLSGAAGL